MPKTPEHTTTPGVFACLEAIVTMAFPDTLEDLISTTEAANEIGCTPQTISRWAKLKYIHASGLDPQYRPLYKRIDILRAERDRRRNALGRRAG